MPVSTILKTCISIFLLWVEWCKKTITIQKLKWKHSGTTQAIFGYAAYLEDERKTILAQISELKKENHGNSNGLLKEK